MNDNLTFLWFKTTKDAAFNQFQSPAIDIYHRQQLQLLPGDPKPYIQITDSPESINIDPLSYTPYIVDCEGNELSIVEHVDLVKFNDANGIGQIYIRLKYLPLDFGTNLVYLKIVSTWTYYSNPFLLTREGERLTTRIDYKYTGVNIPGSPTRIIYNSARLRMYYNRYVAATKLDIYYQITRSQNVTSKVNKDRRIEWVWELSDEWHWIRLEESLYNSACYFNFVRNYPAEALELEPREGDSNISGSTFLTDPNEKDTINIADIIIVIDPDPLIAFVASSSTLSSSSLIISSSQVQP